jgi:fucose permease
MAERAAKHSLASVKLSDVMFAGLLSFFLQGAATVFYGPALYYISSETGQSVANLGVLFVLHWSGFFASTLVANRIARKLEMRRSAAGASFLMGMGALGLALMPFPFNLMFAFWIGFGSGMLEIMLNRLVEMLAGDTPAAALTRLHATFGVGAFVMPLLIALVEVSDWNWRGAGLILAGIAFGNGAAILRWREFQVWHGDPMHWRALPWKSISVFVGLIVIYIGVETAVGGWATTFFAKLGQGPILGAIATSLFFLTFTLGRVVLADSTDRWGFARAVRLGAGSGAAALALTFFEPLALIGFALAGVAFSIVFPTLLAWGPRRHPEIRAQMASLSIAAAGVGGIAIPYLIGLGVGNLGAWALTPMLIVTAFSVGALTFFETPATPT